MTVFRVVHHFVATQDVTLLEPVRKGMVLDGCPFHWHLQFIFAAAIAYPTEKGNQSVVNNNYQNYKSSLTQDQHISENAVKGAIEDSQIERQERSIGLEETWSSVAPN